MRRWYQRKSVERARDRARNGTPERLASLQASKDRYPEKHRARVAVHNAVARGTLKKEPCEVCGDVRVQAHHEDYSKPLDVAWLCVRHHRPRHGLPYLEHPNRSGA
jgi:hypothetical protein